MNEDELIIEERTLHKLIKLKKNNGFENKTWDEWFNSCFNIKSEKLIR